MNDRQKNFCNYYIESLNGTDAARKAGYSEKNARNKASEFMKKKEIKDYINDIMESKNNKLIASQDEILEKLTSIMRGEAFVEKSYINNAGERKHYKRYPNFVEITKAAELLGRRYNMWNDKQVIEIADTDIHVTIEGEGEEIECEDKD